MEWTEDRKRLEELLDITRKMAARGESTVKELELKLKYPQTLIYEVEVKLLAERRSLACSREILKFAYLRIASLPVDDVTSADGANESPLTSVDESRQIDLNRKRRTLSDEERERRRQRMKNMWANGTLQAVNKTAT